MSSQSLQWIIANHPLSDEIQTLSSALAIPSFVAKLLCQRGFRDKSAAREFLNPRLKSLSDPYLLPNMREAVAAILRAVDQKKRIVLYGDYDVDGVTSLAIFSRVLREFGADPKCFLPMRVEEGYGLTAEGLQRCIAGHQPELLIALDCGTSSLVEIASLTTNGIEVIVFDHHELKTAAPDCILVNPKLGETFHYLCTAGVIFKTAHALLKTRPLANCDLKEYLDLAALGTIADIVPLLHENRILVQKGLAQMQHTRWPGLRALLEVSAVRGAPTASDIGFRLGPRLNAAGRLNTAEAALELLLTEDESHAQELAKMLDTQNRERQTVERSTLIAVQKQIESIFDSERDAAIVVSETGWHPGVIGIVASRLCRSHHRPTFVIGFDENGIGKGSGRSIEGFSLVHALAECGEYLEKFGGHQMAAGLTIRRECFEDFQKKFQQAAAKILTRDLLQPRLRLDCEMAISELDEEFFSQYEQLAPFGSGNAQPVFIAQNVTTKTEPRILKEKHLLFQLQQNRCTRSAIFFNGAKGELPQPPWDIAFKIERSDYARDDGFQMQIVAIRSAVGG